MKREKVDKMCKILQTLKGSWSCVTTNSIQKILGAKAKVIKGGILWERTQRCQNR